MLGRILHRVWPYSICEGWLRHQPLVSTTFCQLLIAELAPCRSCPVFDSRDHFRAVLVLILGSCGHWIMSTDLGLGLTKIVSLPSIILQLPLYIVSIRWLAVLLIRLPSTSFCQPLIAVLAPLFSVVLGSCSSSCVISFAYVTVSVIPVQSLTLSTHPRGRILHVRINNRLQRLTAAGPAGVKHLGDIASTPAGRTYIRPEIGSNGSGGGRGRGKSAAR